MKIFYRISDEMFNKLVKLDEAYDAMSDLDIDYSELKLPDELEALYSLFEEWNSYEFEHDEAVKLLSEIGESTTLSSLEDYGYIIETFNNKDYEW